MALALENLYGLRIRTPRVELRIPTNNDIKVLHRVARGGIHDPAVMPFADPWTDKPEPEFGRSMQAELRQGRNTIGRTGWNVPFVVRARDVGSPLLGVAWLRSTEEPGRFETSAWIARRFQGKGYGREVEAAVLAFAFEQCGAQEVSAGTFAFNGAGRSLARGAGFVETPADPVLNRGELAEYVTLTLDAAGYRNHAGNIPVTVAGFDRVAHMFPVAREPELALGDR